MRLTQQEIEIIKSSVHDVIGKNANIWLFGSRADDSKRGGDIDLFIEADLPDPIQRLEKKLQLWTKLQLRLGEQQIDIIIKTTESKESKLIEEVAKKTGILL